jgi:hypothetical protein
MIIITAVIYSIPYFICLVWFLHLRKQNKKQRIEFLDFKIVTSENFRIANKNYKGQDENWVKIESYMKRNDELNSIQSYINIDNLEIFQEFDSIINELDKKVNTALDDQEKYSIKRDRYENRLTEVCKAFDSLKVIMNKNTKLTADNFGAVNKVLGSIEINFNKIKDLPKKVDEIDRTLNLSLQRIGMNKVKFENIIKAIENPIEVTRPSCETKLKLKQEAEANKVETVTEIVNKVDFTWYNLYCGKGTKFVLTENSLKVLDLDGNLFKTYYNEDKISLLKKVIELNEPKLKRKYTKKANNLLPKPKVTIKKIQRNEVNGY